MWKAIGFPEDFDIRGVLGGHCYSRKYSAHWEVHLHLYFDISWRRIVVRMTSLESADEGSMSCVDEQHAERHLNSFNFSISSHRKDPYANLVLRHACTGPAARQRTTPLTACRTLRASSYVCRCNDRCPIDGIQSVYEDQSQD